MINNKKVLADPLSEASLPNFARLGINHHSSTSLSYPDGVFVYRYIICDQETRRMFEGNANMAAGVACGDAGFAVCADENLSESGDRGGAVSRRGEPCLHPDAVIRRTDAVKKGPEILSERDPARQ